MLPQRVAWKAWTRCVVHTSPLAYRGAFSKLNRWLSTNIASSHSLMGIEGSGRRTGACVAIIDGNGVHTYNDLARLSMSVATKLSSVSKSASGLGHVSVLCSSDASYVTALWAIWSSGGTAVPLCVSHPTAEMRYFVDDSRSSCIVASPELAPRAQELGLPVVVVTPSTTVSPNLPGGITGGLGDVASCDGSDGFGGIAAEESRAALIIYTSGTTSKPKGTVMTFGNLKAQLENMTVSWEWMPSDVIVHALPLHHVHGVVNALLTPLHSGATVLMHSKFDAAQVWSALLDTKSSANILMGVPTMYAKLIEHYEQTLSREISLHDVRKRCLQAIRLMVSGSAALPQPIMNRWHDITGHWLLERYGMTEVGMALTNPLRGERRAGTVGQPFPSVRVCIVRPSSATTDGYEVICEGSHASTKVTPGLEQEQGELLIAGPSVFTEYWNKPKETAETFTPDGWFRTGDSARYSDGYFSILGRLSVDIIKSGGYKISALDVERELLAHDAIAECAVIGLPDYVWGQKVAAVVVMKAQRTALLTVAELKEWARERLANYQMPSIVLCVPQLPRNAMGKINKKQLVAQLFPENGQKQA